MVGWVREGRGGWQERHRTVHVPDEVDKLSLIVDALFLRDRPLFFTLPMEVGEEKGAGSTSTDGQQGQDSHQDHVEADAAMCGI